MVLPAREWAVSILGILSRHINIESQDAALRRLAEDTLTWELNFAHHLNLSAVLMSIVKPNNANFSRALRGFLLKNMGPQIWLRIPMVAKESEPWNWWNTLRSCADVEKRLHVALELGQNSPSDAVITRWIGEPVKALIVPVGLFIPNKKGYMVLPRSIQAVIRKFIDLKVQFIVEGNNRDANVKCFQQYLDHIVKQHFVEDPLKQHAQGFEDYLQSPLQPLMDNLESATYEVFEKDPVKYTEYQRAIREALLDRVTDEEAKTKVVTLMVLGAGRGPLVRAALEAANESGRQVKVFAVEKNPYAVVTLRLQKEETWGDKVEVISSDMRNWKPTEDQLADIIVSELLGSFGDNELSPECLYSSQHVMKPDGISIPCSYTSWVSPIQSSKLYQEVRGSADQEKNPEAHFETPYVVHLQNFYEIAQPQPLFTFDHPVPLPSDNTRYDIKTFVVKDDCVLNGFAGYFECTLYKDIFLSTNPATHSKGMISWFPIFFPIRSPVHLSKGSEVELHFWRLNSSKQVWYEWCITKPVPISIHNPNGRSYTIGL